MELNKMIGFLETLIPKESMVEKEDYYLLPTICHNFDHKDASHKLYLYKNPDATPLFHCYTECSETFNIYQLVQKYSLLRGEKLTYREAFKKVHGVNYVSQPEFDVKEVKYDTKFKNPLTVQLPEYSKNALDMFFLDELHPWAMEGADINVLDDFEIGYSKSLEQVSIPHYDWRGRLVGIRVRNFNPYKVDNFKYMPLQASNMFFSHPLSLNFYGIFKNQMPIKKRRRVYLYEGEKSVIFHQWMFDNQLALSVCGKNLSKWHSDMLINFLNVDQVIIGFDKEYNDYSSAFDYVKKIEAQTIYLRQFASVGVLIDDNNVMQHKESPVDGTKKDFEQFNIWWLE